MFGGANASGCGQSGQRTPVVAERAQVVRLPDRVGDGAGDDEDRAVAQLNRLALVGVVRASAKLRRAELPRGAVVVCKTHRKTITGMLCKYGLGRMGGSAPDSSTWPCDQSPLSSCGYVP